MNSILGTRGGLESDAGVNTLRIVVSEASRLMKCLAAIPDTKLEAVRKPDRLRRGNFATKLVYVIGILRLTRSVLCRRLMPEIGLPILWDVVHKRQKYSMVGFFLISYLHGPGLIRGAIAVISASQPTSSGSAGKTERIDCRAGV